MKIAATLVALTALLTASTTAADAQSIGTYVPAEVTRGDANGDGVIDRHDPRTMLEILFHGAQPTVSARNLDANGDGQFDLADVDTVGASLQPAAEPPDPRSPEPRAPDRERARSDLNGDGRTDMNDVKLFLAIFFSGHPSPVPERELDQNDDGSVNLFDVFVVMAEADATARAAAPEPEEVMLGDLTDDGSVDIADFIALLDLVVRGENPMAPREAADVNSDGRVDYADISVLGEAIL